MSGLTAEQIMREHERLRFALETSHTGTWELNLADNTAVRSPEHARIFGYERLPPKWSYEMFLEHVVPEDRASVRGKVGHAMETRGDLSLECRIRRRDGVERWIWVAAQHRCDDQGVPRYLAGIVQDITERKWTREALNQASVLNQQIISGAKEGIIVYGQDLKYQVWNPFMEQLTGMPASQVLGRHPFEVFPFLKEAGLIKQLTRILTGKECGPLEFHFEVPQTKRSGWVSDTNSALRDADGKIIGVVGMVRDIGERKKAEERIAQLSRVRAILSGIDHAILHIADRQKLLDEICRVAVREGGFELAWVGMVTPENVVEPVAQAGRTGYLKKVRIVTRDEPRGRGPVGRAIREQRPVVISNIDLDRRMSPWLERARRFGLHYVAAFPLRIGGKVVGAFQAYAPRPDFFNEAEVALLTQVSDDISFALNALAGLEAREKAEAELRRSEENLSNFFEQAPIGLMWLSDKGTILRVNRAESELLGYSADEFLGHCFTKFCRDRETGRQLLRLLAAGERVHNMVMTHGCKDGSVRHVLVDANSLWRHGRLQYSSVFLRDISDRVGLERELMQVGEREHRRIAQDLHDGLGQLLAGTAYLTGVLQQELATKAPPQARQLHRIQEVINEAIGVTRNLARGLHPVEPVPNGLMIALQSLAHATERLFRVRCRFVCRRSVLIQDNTQATHLFRIAQEAVTNSIKHGRARRILVQLRETSKAIQLIVKDDGHGFSRQAGKLSGAGLRIMRYRAGIIGASVVFQARPGDGTAVVCTLPIENHQLPEVVWPKANRQQELPIKRRS